MATGCPMSPELHVLALGGDYFWSALGELGWPYVGGQVATSTTA